MALSVDSLIAQGKLPEETHAERKGIGILPLDEVIAIGNRNKGDPDLVLPPLELDPHRSLFIHDKVPLSRITFEALMERLAASAQSGTGTDLFRQWWRSLAPGSAVEVQQGLGCDPAENVEQTETGDRVRCDPVLAQFATIADPFGAAPTQPNFIIVGAVNRIDLMPEQNQTLVPNCGEYRLVAAANPQWSGIPTAVPRTFEAPSTRVLLNFEAVLSGDEPFCRSVQWLWASFTAMNNAELAVALERFFLLGGDLTPDGKLLESGLGGPGAVPFDPVMSVENLGGDPGASRGQIRTNTLSDEEWVYREYEFKDIGDVLRVVATSVDGAPNWNLFKGDQNNPDAIALANAIETAGSLAVPNINRFSFVVPGGLEPMQMIVNVGAGGKDTRSFGTVLDSSPSTRGTPNVVEDSIAALAANTGFGANEIETRLEALSCAGCHRIVANRARAKFVDGDNLPLVWKRPKDFAHVDERDPSGMYELSPALTCFMLPHRELVMRAFLSSPIDPTPAPPIPTSCRPPPG